MALRTSWTCSLCTAYYRTLLSLVGHIRGAHSNATYLNCAVSGGTDTFHNTNKFYKHVQKTHAELYFRKPEHLFMDSDEGLMTDVKVYMDEFEMGEGEMDEGEMDEGQMDEVPVMNDECTFIQPLLKDDNDTESDEAEVEDVTNVACKFLVRLREQHTV